MKIVAINTKMFNSKIELGLYKNRLKKLTDASNLPEYMGELFLRELILSNDDANRHLRERAVLLGLAKAEYENGM